MGIWVGALAVGFVYMTDWKVIMEKIPYVRGRFPKDSNEEQ